MHQPFLRFATLPGCTMAAALLLACGPLAAQTADKRAEFLLAERLPCTGCHSLDGRGGAIGPDLSGVGLRRSAQDIRRIMEAPDSVFPGTVMPRVPMSSDTRERIVAYLSQRKTTAAVTPALPRTAASKQASGAALYAERCAACHGGRGGGDGPNAVKLVRRPAVHSDSKVMSTRPDERLYDGIHAGGRALGVSHQMPAYGATLTSEQIWSLVRYIRELCRCTQPGWANGR